MPRKTSRRQISSVPLSSAPKKILLVGPTLSGKTSFVKSFFHPSQHNTIIDSTGVVGLEAYPITYLGKKYSIWDASTEKEDHLLSWSKGSSMIVVFGDDTTWIDRMKNLFPNTLVRAYNPHSKIENLESSL